MPRSKARHSCTRTSTGRKRSMNTIRKQAKTMGLKATGTKQEICNRITSKLRRSKSKSRTRRSKSRTRRSRSGARRMRRYSRASRSPASSMAQMIDCRQYSTSEPCVGDPNCNWLGGSLQRCQARSGVRQGQVYSGPIQQFPSTQPTARAGRFAGITADMEKKLAEARKKSKSEDLTFLQRLGLVSKSPQRSQGLFRSPPRAPAVVPKAPKAPMFIPKAPPAPMAPSVRRSPTLQDQIIAEANRRSRSRS